MKNQNQNLFHRWIEQIIQKLKRDSDYHLDLNLSNDG